MGKPFQSELNQLGNTIKWIITESMLQVLPIRIDPSVPTYCVGSGGSQSAADFFARLVRMENGFAWATTPLEYLNIACYTPRFSTILLSASGKNKDILAAAQHAIRNESLSLSGIITRSGSPLANEIMAYSSGTVLELDIPSGNDGFLATNSLIAMMLTMLKLFSISSSDAQIAQLYRTASNLTDFKSPIEFSCSNTEVIIIYAGWGGPAAIDLESKLSEAALAPSMLCDIRSFGHGRHHWLAKRSAKSVVVAVEDKEYMPLFRKTLSLIPSEVPVIRLTSDCSGPSIAIDLMLKVFGFVQYIGNMIGIDPGRPGVPDFGRKIYHISPTVRKFTEPCNVTVASQRRLQTMPIKSSELLQQLEAAASEFIHKVCQSDICAIVLDYDGTLVDTIRRFQPIDTKISNELKRLLKAGIILGIATGRGKSVREALRQAIPEEEWHHVIVGYYNASQLIALDEERLPSVEISESDSLYDIKKILLNDTWMNAVPTLIELRPQQLSVSGAVCSHEVLWIHIMRLLATHKYDKYKCLSSTHSIDIIPISVSKLAVVQAISNYTGCLQENVLCIGDSGLWPGNDYELLSHFPSLSSGLSPYDLSTGWNIAPSGMTQSTATRFYIEHLTGANPMHFALEKVR